MGMSTAVRSHAKINLGLYLGAPRADGFHGLATIYQTLAMHDTVTVTARSAAATALRLTSNDSRVPTDNRNTAWKMVELALQSLGLTAEVEIHIDKRLPVQGGLGAGSANAVAALVGLENELRIADRHVAKPEDQQAGGSAGGREKSGDGDAEPSAPVAAATFAQDDKSDWRARWIDLAAQVGSDVPLFLIGGTVLGLDRGQQVYPLPDIEPAWCVVAAPAEGVSTPQAFRDWDAISAAEGLTAEASTAKLKELSRAYARAFQGSLPEGAHGTGSSGVLPEFGREDLAGRQESALVRTGITSWIENDFERVVFPQHPSLAEIKRLLAAAGSPEAALYASLSGSGSALYGLYLARGDAEAAQRRLQKQFQGLDVRLTQTLPRKEYWDRMILS